MLIKNSIQTPIILCSEIPKKEIGQLFENGHL